LAVTIGIDPGHGGKDPGALGQFLGLEEKYVTLDVGLKLDELLQQRGLTTVLTRSSDQYLTLGERATVLNESGVDLVLSLHVNSAANTEARYVSAHVFQLGGKAEKAAAKLVEVVIRATGWESGGVKVNNFYMLRETTAPAVLLEMGFVSNEEQERLLNRSETRDLLARSLAEGITQIYGLEPPGDELQGHWAAEAIKTVINQGLMQGYPDGSFQPEKPVSRAELAVVLVRLLEMS